MNNNNNKVIWALCMCGRCANDSCNVHRHVRSFRAKAKFRSIARTGLTFRYGRCTSASKWAKMNWKRMRCVCLHIAIVSLNVKLLLKSERKVDKLQNRNDSLRPNGCLGTTTFDHNFYELFYLVFRHRTTGSGGANIKLPAGAKWSFSNGPFHTKRSSVANQVAVIVIDTNLLRLRQNFFSFFFSVYSFSVNVKYTRSLLRLKIDSIQNMLQFQWSSLKTMKHCTDSICSPIYK